MLLSRMAQVALPVADIDRAVAFYRDALGLPPLFRFGTLAFFDCGNLRLMLDGSTERPLEASSACHYFAIDDIVAAAATIKAKGVTFVDEPHLVARMPDHELWMTFFRDPDGHLLALMEERR